jgi:hypothetical protein
MTVSRLTVGLGLFEDAVLTARPFEAMVLRVIRPSSTQSKPGR